MALLPPILDDLTFEQLTEQARTLIPRYAPEWTDHNESDPGIALLQLFAWLTEQLLYRLNQVPERNYLKFLQLLGIQPKPAQPAKAELTFTLDRETMAEHLEAVTYIPKGIQVAGADGGEEAPPVFETERSLVAIQAGLDCIQGYDGFSFTSLTNANQAAGQSFYPLGPQARQGSALLLGFESPLDFTDEQVDILFYVFTGGDLKPLEPCDSGLTYLPTQATLAWEYWDRSNWRPLNLIVDETRAFLRSGYVSFMGPGVRIKKDKMGLEKTEELYWIRARLVESAYQRPPRLERILINSVSAIQAITVVDEVLGGSDGRPDQRFTLANLPVIAREERDQDGITQLVSSLRVEIEELPRAGLDNPGSFELWTEVKDFFNSGEDDRHYVLDRTTGEIRFGDGIHGRIPPANTDNPSGNIIARSYQFGGGQSGNLPAGKITELQTSIDYVEGVTNYRASLGGTEEETVEAAKLRAGQVIKSRDRAVTIEDFEVLAKETPGARIGKAKALPLAHPRFPGTSIPGAISVVVIPESEDDRPLPSEEAINMVCTYLSKHRLLTSEVFVVPPTYRKISIKADLVARPEADLGEVKQRVDDRLKTYFHPLKGGERGNGWQFGHDIAFSDIYRLILGVPGVDRIEGDVSIIVDDEREARNRDVRLEDGQLLYAESHQISVSYRRRE